jgi:GYF domain 2
MGAVAAAIASSKGRSAAGWFFAGLFLDLIGIIIIAVLPNLKEQKAKEEQIERENRRLREQLIQEQIKTEAFRRHASARLDSHDAHLGVDTRSAVSALPAPDRPIGLEQSPPGINSELSPDELFNSSPSSSLSGSSSNNQPSAAVPVLSNPASSNAAPSVQDVTARRQWYFEVQGQARGPISDKELVAYAQTGQIVDGTLVWTEQLGNWRAAGTIKSLKPYLRS